MAIANFFDKAALAAAQVLDGVDHSSLIALLKHQLVGIAFDDNAVSTFEGKCTLELTVNLLARFYPKLAFKPKGKAADIFTDDLTKIAKSINPDIELTLTKTGKLKDTPSVYLVVGQSNIKSDVPVIYIGSDGWIVRLSSKTPVGSANTINPYGAGAAACFGAANIFRFIFKDFLTEGKFDSELTLSLIDYDPDSRKPKNPKLKEINLESAALVGLGAVGNAAVWSLSRTPFLKGSLDLIDDEKIDLTNLQRYILSTQSDIDAVKVDLGLKQFQSTDLEVINNKDRWGDFYRKNSAKILNLVAVAVDSDTGRQAIQAALPEWVVNAWTQAGDLGVSRHDFIGENACLTCLYFPQEKGKNLDQIVAAALGLPNDLMEIRTLLYNNAPVGRSLLERSAQSLKIPVEQLFKFEDEPLYQFYTKAVCGGVVLKLGGNFEVADKQNTAVPLAFQSALAGIMLAAEMIIHAGELRKKAFFTTTKIDLLRPLKKYLNQPALKEPTLSCICHDRDYINVYKSRHKGLFLSSV